MFNKIAANSDAAKALEQTLVEASGRTNYNEMVRELNSTDVGGFLSFPWEREKASTIHQQLANRGLTRDGDYVLSFGNVGGTKNAGGEVTGGTETAFIKRVSAKEGTFVTPAKRGPRVAKEEAAAPVAAPVAAPAAAPAKPAAAPANGAKTK